MKYFATLLFLALAIPASAQITFTGDQFSQLFLSGKLSNTTDYSSTATTQLQPLVDLSGVGKQWDFSGIPFTQNAPSSGNVTIVAYPGGAANAADFTGATHVEIETNGQSATYYTFYKIDATGMYGMGQSSMYNGVSDIINIYNPPLEILKFPTTYLTSWTSTSTITANSTHGMETVDGVIDSWGTFTVPGGQPHDCLRLKQTIVYKDSLGAPQFGGTQYQWLSPEAYGVTVNVDADNKATDGNYSVPTSSKVSENGANNLLQLNVGSNPVASSTNLSYSLSNDSHVKIAVMDALGQESRIIKDGIAHSGVNTVPFDASKLSNGSYFLRIESQGNSSIRKLIVAH